MNPLDFVPKSALAVVAAVLLATSCKFKLDNNGMSLEIEKGKVALAEVKKAHSELVAAASASYANTTNLYRQREQGLQAKMDSERRITDEKVAYLVTERNALRVRLSQAGTRLENYPAYNGGTPTFAGVEKTATGDYQPELPEQVRGLIDEAYRADQIRVELLGCYKAYDRALLATSPQVQTPASQ